MADTTPTVSLCIITKNEESYIKDCLESVANLVSEIVLVDTGSTDKTIAIARNFPGLRLFEIAWENDFSKAKNFAVSQATGRYILILDADERLSCDDISKLRNEIEQNPFVDAFRLPIRNYTYNAKELSWQPNHDHYRERFPYPGYVLTHLCRLFKKSPDVFYTGCVHELIEPQLQDNRKMVMDIEIPIHHLGKIKEIIDKTFQKRYENYLEIHKQNVDRNPHSSKAFFELGINYLMLDDYRSARRSFERALEIEAFFPEAIKHLCITLLKLRDFQETLALIHKSQRYYGADPDFLLLKGVALLELQQHRQAEETLELAVKANPALFPAIVSLGEIKLNQNATSDARVLFKEAERLNPTDEVLQLNLARIAEKEGHPTEALTILEGLEKQIAASPRPTLTHDKVLFEEARLLMKEKAYDQAKDKLEKAYAKNEGSAALCIALATVHQHLNNPKASQEYIDRAALLDPSYERLKVTP